MRGTSTHLASVLPDTLPQGLEHGVEGLDTIGCGGFSQSSDSQGTDGTHLLLLIHQTYTQSPDRRLLRYACILTG